jgi:enterochelin esterase-like enzyme
MEIVSTPPHGPKNGGVNLILDELIAQGKARPMIVVMPHGYGNYRFFLGGDKNWVFPALIDQNVNLFSRMLLTEIIPQVESDYRVSTKRKDRAIAGLSLGGREAITIGLENPRKFNWIGGFSAAFPSALPHFERERIEDIDPETADLRLLWISCGVSDPLVFGGNTRLIAQLKKDDLPVTTVFTNGGHDWPVWRHNFKQFGSQLFQPK